MLILSITEYLDELFENGGLAPITPLGELCGIMVVTIDLAIVLIITVLCAEYGGA